MLENVCVYTHHSPGHKRKAKYRIARRTTDNRYGTSAYSLTKTFRVEVVHVRDVMGS